MDQIRQHLGRVLAVAMQQHYKVEFEVYCIVIADFLIASISLVNRVEKNRHLEWDQTFGISLGALAECSV